ncbi:hypothetical protein SPRG_22275 [Saprolegnia parasitica CBS 223.65]|uniref:EGF-like domain-containing protein n=1 Tax=Saprolegnia parasitica (strain CBS 223.65) TaxID=695850 RepID=A0A067C8X0_SAPPC|nr:hypothetical protein SPRG_22275 [Saprolegnia parasitica CBS 223.65]KDO23237.1 hypothetical protein SPRG_22275 [Saprolegnia parasitica CBS 223.65]|eukprot:XP_012206082.1 hypothetical protein SPRG_22275 [Saprolegnia parasitica CBS 223.65]
MKTWPLTATLLACAAIALAQKVKKCPGGENPCSLHGSCMISRMGEYVCNCQWGYTGADCSQKMCPHGVDPTTSATKQEKKVRLQVRGPSEDALAAAGRLFLTFHGHTVEMEVDAAISSERCTKVFQRFHNLGTVSCVRSPTLATSDMLLQLDITLHSFPIYPIMNNLYFHDGNPPATDFGCDTGGAKSLACAFTSLADANVKGYVPCANHGKCNARSGLCACEPGFYGVHCGHNDDAADMLLGLAQGPFFSGNLLKLSAARSPDAAFNLMHVDVGGIPVFTMDGRGDTTLHQGSLVLEALRASRIEVHGDVSVHRANLHVHDGHVRVQKTLDGDGMASPVLAIDARVQTETCVVDEIGSLFRVALNDVSLLSLDALGRLETKAVAVHETLHVAKDTTLDGNVAIAGAASIRAGLDVATNGLRVAQGGAFIGGGASIGGAHPSMAMRPVGIRESQLRLEQPSGSPAAYLTCASNEKRVFEIAATGMTTVHGLDVQAGGVAVHAGGQVIHSGGLRIASGGLHVEKGHVQIDGSLSFQGGLVVNGSESATPSLVAQAAHAHFASSVLHLDASAVDLKASAGFQLVQATTAAGTVLAIDGFGNLTTVGSLHADGAVVAKGPLVAETQALLRPTRLVAAKHLAIPCTHSYVQVLSDGATHPSSTQTISMDGAAYGQLLVVQNADEDALSSLKIPPQSSALFVFDGQAWQTLTATEFDTTQLVNVKEFSAAADLNIGNHMLSAKSIQVAGQTASHVAYYGKGGVLTGDASLSYESASQTLNTHQLKVHALVGKIDMSNSELRGVDIIGGHLRGINLSALTLEVAGEMFVESNAFVGGWLTVDGQVMGSGSYVDSSDARFKTNVSTLVNALPRLQQLRGVTYDYKTDAFPKKHFSTRSEIGFIAQEIEAVVPEVVTTDADGFKYVAYARIVPLAVEAIKEQAATIEALTDAVRTLQAQVAALQALVAQTVDSSRR